MLLLLLPGKTLIHVIQIILFSLMVFCIATMPEFKGALTYWLYLHVLLLFTCSFWFPYTSLLFCDKEKLGGNSLLRVRCGQGRECEAQCIFRKDVFLCSISFQSEGC